MPRVVEDLRGVAVDSRGGVVDSAHCDGCWILISFVEVLLIHLTVCDHWIL